MTDRILSVLGLFMLIGFLFVLVWYVQRLDLTIICAVVVLMATYDFYDETVRRSNNKIDIPDPSTQKDAI